MGLHCDSLKDYKLRLKLGNVVTGVGEREGAEGRVLVGEKTEKVWGGGTVVCETSQTSTVTNFKLQTLRLPH
jgi:hypothetical protein